MSDEKVFISTSSFGEFSQEPIDLLKQAGYQCSFNPYGRTLKSDEVVFLVKDHIGLIAGTEKLGSDALCQLDQLKVISRCGAGIDNLDLIKAKEMNIQIYNTPDAPTLAVAELTLGLIFDLLRKISFSNNEMRSFQWKKQMGNLLHGKRVGIIGLGRIGRKLAEMLNGLGCELAYHDPYVKSDFLNLENKSLPDLLRWANVISIHVSEDNQLISSTELELLQRESWIINTSRERVVDEDALFEFLKSRRIAGAALDVFSEEPYQGKLCTLDNVILTPHIGSYAKEARINMEIEAVKNLLEGLGKSRK